ncbi:MAG: hypothetical protein V3R57_06340 [Candidatus Bathyarchaeia archaeon]
MRPRKKTIQVMLEVIIKMEFGNYKEYVRYGALINGRRRTKLTPDGIPEKKSLQIMHRQLVILAFGSWKNWTSYRTYLYRTEWRKKNPSKHKKSKSYLRNYYEKNKDTKFKTYRERTHKKRQTLEGKAGRAREFQKRKNTKSYKKYLKKTKAYRATLKGREERRVEALKYWYGDNWEAAKVLQELKRAVNDKEREGRLNPVERKKR